MTARKVAEEMARQIMGRSNYMTEAGQTTTILCKEVLEAEIASALLDAEQRGMERAAVADEWLKAGVMELRAGEMSAQEKRTIRAVVRSIVDAIRKLGGRRNP